MGPQKSIVVLVLFCAIALSCCQNEEEVAEDAKKIDYFSQGITVVSSDFSGFTELEEIDYSNNDIVEIDVDAFAENPKLRYINLSGNRKLSLPENGPFLVASVKMLNLSGCNIETIPAKALDGMKTLEILDLTNNPINFENSPVFDILEYPPRKIIVSEISEVDLYYICRNVDMTVVVKRETRQEYECKNVRKEKGELGKSQNVEMVSQEDDNVDVTIIEENLLKVGTHMEMMSDQPDEGSGDDTVIIPEEVDSAKDDEEVEVTSQEDNDATVSAFDSVDTSDKDIEDESQDEEIKPVVIDGTGAHDEVVTAENEEEEEEAKTEVSAPKKSSKGKSKVAPKQLDEEDKVIISISRSLPVETISTEHTADANKTGDNVKAADPPVGETVEETTSATSSIVLVLIIAVVVVGSALVGFKYYKNRKPSYAVVNGVPKDDQSEGKELKEIVTMKPESQPLMVPRPDVQFEEVNEKVEPTENEVPAEDAANETTTPPTDDDTPQTTSEENNKSETL